MGARKQRTSATSTEPVEIVGVTPSVNRSEALEGLDDLLDEIDEALEVNAEEFVRNYVQKGGQ